MSGTKWLQKQEHFDWMQKCLTCWKMCEAFMVWSIRNGKYVSSINACRDVTEICSQCIKFEAQRSPFFQHLCQVCAEICEKFAADVATFENENEIISETANSSRIFAQVCREVANKENGKSANTSADFIRKQGDS